MQEERSLSDFWREASDDRIGELVSVLKGADSLVGLMGSALGVSWSGQDGVSYTDFRNHRVALDYSPLRDEGVPFRGVAVDEVIGYAAHEGGHCIWSVGADLGNVIRGEVEARMTWRRKLPRGGLRRAWQEGEAVSRKATLTTAPPNPVLVELCRIHNILEDAHVDARIARRWPVLGEYVQTARDRVAARHPVDMDAIACKARPDRNAVTNLWVGLALYDHPLPQRMTKRVREAITGLLKLTEDAIAEEDLDARMRMAVFAGEILFRLFPTKEAPLPRQPQPEPPAEAVSDGDGDDSDGDEASDTDARDDDEGDEGGDSESDETEAGDGDDESGDGDDEADTDEGDDKADDIGDSESDGDDSDEGDAEDAGDDGDDEADTDEGESGDTDEGDAEDADIDEGDTKAGDGDGDETEAGDGGDAGSDGDDEADSDEGDAEEGNGGGPVGGDAPDELGNLDEDFSDRQVVEVPQEILEEVAEAIIHELEDLSASVAEVLNTNPREVLTNALKATHDPERERQVTREVMPQVMEVRRVFAEQEQAASRTLKGLERGKLNGRRLARVGAGKYNVFQQRQVMSKPDMAVGLLLDVSGSMSPYMGIVEQTAAIFAEALSGLRGVNFAAWTYTCGYAWDKTVLTRICDPQMGRLALGDIEKGGGTPSGPAIAAAKVLLERLPERKKVLIHFTDGAPDDDGHVVKAVEAARNAGIAVYAIGLGVYVGNLPVYGEGNWEVIESVPDLPKAVGTLLTRLDRF